MLIVIGHHLRFTHMPSLVTHNILQEIFQDRHKFSEKVFEVASSDLVNMGITVVSYTLKDIHDDEVGVQFIFEIFRCKKFFSLNL